MISGAEQLEYSTPIRISEGSSQSPELGHRDTEKPVPLGIFARSRLEITLQLRGSGGILQHRGLIYDIFQLNSCRLQARPLMLGIAALRGVRAAPLEPD